MPTESLRKGHLPSEQCTPRPGEPREESENTAGPGLQLISGQTITEDFGGAPLAGFLFVVAASLPLAVNAGAYLVGTLVLLGGIATA